MSLSGKKSIVNSIICLVFFIATLVNFYSLYGCIISAVLCIAVVAFETYSKNKDKLNSKGTGDSLSRILAVSFFNLNICWLFKYVDLKTFADRFDKFAENIVAHLIVSVVLIIAVRFFKLSGHPFKLLLRYAALSLLTIPVLADRIKDTAAIITLVVIFNLCLYLIDTIGEKNANSNLFVFVLGVLSNIVVVLNMFITVTFRTLVIEKINNLSILTWSTYSCLIAAGLSLVAGIICYELDKKSKVMTDDCRNMVLVGFNFVYLMLVDKFRNSFSLIFMMALIVLDVIALNSTWGYESKKKKSNKNVILQFALELVGLVVLLISFVNGCIDIFVAVVGVVCIIFLSKKPKIFAQELAVYLVALLICFRFNSNYKIYILVTAVYLILGFATVILGYTNPAYIKDIEEKRRKVVLVILAVVLLAVSFSSGVSLSGFNKIRLTEKGVPYVKIISENRNEKSKISEINYYWDFNKDKTKTAEIKKDGSFHVVLPENKSVLTVVVEDSDDVVTRYVHVY